MIAYPVLKFICLPLLLLALGTFCHSPKRQERAGEIQMSMKLTDFTGRFSATLFYLACFRAVLGHMSFSNHEALSRPGFPLEWYIILPSNVAIVNSCLRSSNCFELHTIWITQYGINKASLFCSPLLKSAIVISGDIIFPCLPFDYAKEQFFSTLQLVLFSYM